jgi:hypothetical protein
MSERRSGGRDWGGWLIPAAALLVAAGLLVFTLMPRNEPAPRPSPVPSASPGDEHEVVTDEGVVSFQLENDAIVVRLKAETGTTELGRAHLPFMATAPPGGTRAPTGTAMFVMACGPVGTPDARRYVFGHLDTGGTAKYTGPEAVGHGASDGLFLFALVPGAASGPVSVMAGTRSRAGFGATAFDDAPNDGTKQPSGCFVIE